MTLTKQDVHEIVATYITAWTQQDPNLIVTIFTDTATYHERLLEEPIRTRDGIRAYWQTKVVESQANIDCRLLSLYLDGDTAVVEWQTEFDDLPKMARRRMREIAVLTFEGRLISSLREYWVSEVIADLITEPHSYLTALTIPIYSVRRTHADAVAAIAKLASTNLELATSKAEELHRYSLDLLQEAASLQQHLANRSTESSPSS